MAAALLTAALPPCNVGGRPADSTRADTGRVIVECYGQRAIVYGMLVMPDTVARPVRFEVEEAMAAPAGSLHWIGVGGRPPQWDRAPGISERPYRLELESVGQPTLRWPVRVRVSSGGAEDRQEGTVAFAPCGAQPAESLRMDFRLRRGEAGP